MKIKAVIVQYIPGDLHFDYEDGTFEWFDGIKLEIIEPEQFAGKKIYVYHEESSTDINPWKEVGTKIQFECDKIQDFDKSHVFTGGLKNCEFFS